MDFEIDELVERSIREGKILDESDFENIYEYDKYLTSLLHTSYERGVDMDKFINEFLPKVGYSFLGIVTDLAIDKEDLKLARIYLDHMSEDEGDLWVGHFIIEWIYAGKNRGMLIELIKSLPDLDYFEILEYYAETDAPSYSINFILEVGGGDIDYVKLMNDDRFEETEIEDALVRVIENQI